MKGGVSRVESSQVIRISAVLQKQKVHAKQSQSQGRDLDTVDLA